MNFAFSNLLGAPYRGGNLVLDGRELLSAVGNRVSQVAVRSVALHEPATDGSALRMCLDGSSR